MGHVETGKYSPAAFNGLLVIPTDESHRCLQHFKRRLQRRLFYGITL